jgi:hypothetical protein
MNNLARLPHVRNELNASGTTSQDDDIVRAVERASRFAETFTGCDFVARLATRHLNRHPRACERELRLSQGLASITTLTVDDDGDDTYELTLAETTDYFVVREREGDSNTPIVRLDLNPNGTQLSAWPTAKRAIKIVGLWAYSYELEDALVDTAEELDASETDITLDLTAAALIYPGDTIVIESEQMEATTVSTVTLTVVRGINGTTAATHVTNSDVYVRRYPRDVERAVSADASRFLWWASRGMQDQAGAMREPWPMIRDSLLSFRRWTVG